MSATTATTAAEWAEIFARASRIRTCLRQALEVLKEKVSPAAAT